MSDPIVTLHSHAGCGCWHCQSICDAVAAARADEREKCKVDGHEASWWADIAKWLQNDISTLHEFVQGCGLFDGTDAGHSVVATAVKYAKEYKNRSQLQQYRAEQAERDRNAARAECQQLQAALAAANAKLATMRELLMAADSLLSLLGVDAEDQVRREICTVVNGCELPRDPRQ